MPETLPRRKHNSSRGTGRNLPAPRPLTLHPPPVKGSTEKFLCVLHFIGCSFFSFFRVCFCWCQLVGRPPAPRPGPGSWRQLPQLPNYRPPDPQPFPIGPPTPPPPTLL